MQIRLLQWNVLYKEKADAVLSVLKKIKPDVACLQEVTADSRYNRQVDLPKYFARALRLHYFYKVGQIYQPETDHNVTGNVILSRFPLRHSAFQYLQDPTTEETSATKGGRVYLSADLRLGQTTLTVATTHLTLYPFFRYGAYKRRELAGLKKIVSKRQSHYLLAGDFNSLPTSPIVKMISRYLRNCGPGIDQKTFATKPYRYKSFIANKLQYRIDYVFATPDIRVISSEVYKTNISDHMPIIVNLRIT